MVLALIACKDEKKETAQANTKPVVKVGVSLPLTGDSANVGEAVKASINMAWNEWNQKDTKFYQDTCRKRILSSKQSKYREDLNKRLLAVICRRS